MLGMQRLPGNFMFQIVRRITIVKNCRTRSKTAAEPSHGTETETAEPADVNVNKEKGSLVAAAFQSLKDDSLESGKINTPKKQFQEHVKKNEVVIDERIVNAKTVNSLLSLTDVNGSLSRKHALKIVSILAEWSSKNKVKLSEFENDARFLKICRLLGRTFPKNANVSSSPSETNRISGFRTDDLNTVLGVAGDDEAAKLIASISLPQMVKVMSALAQRKRRSTPLLRSLAYNISSTTDQLDLKQCADILYAMASLNFQDSVLNAKVCADIQLGLTKKIEKSAVIGSILTSLGILKYRDLDIMEAITQWILQNQDTCRSQDLSAYILSSAMLNFQTSNMEAVQTKLIKSIVPEEFNKKIEWLNYVWALSMLKLVSNDQLQVVLNEEFVKLLEKQNSLTPTAKMRLLNLNSYARLIAKDYNGPYLAENTTVWNVPMGHVKSKQTLVNCMLDALKSLLPKTDHLKSLEDSKMGFLIDGVCHFDSKRNPLPLDKITADTIRVALMVIDYHDVCHGTHRSANGVTNLHFDLLEKAGYKIIPVPYNEFSTSDKLLKRVQYLESKFKALINKNV